MIHSFEWAKNKIKEVGEVVRTSRSLVWMTGLENGSIGEGISFENEVHGIIRKLGIISEVMTFSETPLNIGLKGCRTGNKLKVTVGEGLLGHTINALGYTYNGKEPSKNTENVQINKKPLGINHRAEITQFCETGIVTVDTILPLGKGQRELIIGDRKTGKTYFGLQLAISQAKKGTICILSLIGKQRTEIVSINELLEKEKVKDKFILVAEPANAPASQIFLNPYTAMTIAEHFRDQGKDTFIIMDSLSYHALKYREIALVGETFPGRESYPGDIFYIHSKLLERAGSFNIDGKQVHITCLPIVETIEGDLTGFIETNLMSMTDGHLFFDKNIFFSGIRPAINTTLSVTRVGRQTQDKLLRDIGQKILQTLNKYQELQRFLRFGPELTPQVKEIIRLYKGTSALQAQTSLVGIPVKIQIILLGLLWNNLWNGEEAEKASVLIQKDKIKMKAINELIEKSNGFEYLLENIAKEKIRWQSLVKELK